MADSPTIATSIIQSEALQGQHTSSAPSPQSALTGTISASAYDEEAERLAKAAKRLHLTRLAKTFGHIPNVSVGTTFSSRSMCAESAVHRPLMAGIYGTRDEGAYSIVLSGGYKDDEDRGDTIIYTGAGGRQRWSEKDPSKRLYFGPQNRDQTWDDWGNRSLVVSRITGLPVRVIRGWMAGTKYSPVEGYRYDGLYIVVSHWIEKNGKNLDICRYRLERLPGQPPIPLRPIYPASFPQQRRRRERPPTATAQQGTTSVYNTQMRGQTSSTTEPTPLNVDMAVRYYARRANSYHNAYHNARFKRKDFDCYISESEEEEGPPSKKVRTFAICSISEGQSVQVGVLTLRDVSPEPSSSQASGETMVNGDSGGDGNDHANSGDYGNSVNHVINDKDSNHPTDGTNGDDGNVSINCSNDNESEGGEEVEGEKEHSVTEVEGSIGEVLFARDPRYLIQESTTPSTPTHISISSPISRSPSPTIIIESEPSGSRDSTPSVIMVPEEEHESAQEQEEQMDMCSTPGSWDSPPSGSEFTHDLSPSPLVSSAGGLGLLEEGEIEDGASNAQNADDVLGDSDPTDYLPFDDLPLFAQSSLPDIPDTDSCATNETVGLKDARWEQEDEDGCDPAVAGALRVQVGESDADPA